MITDFLIEGAAIAQRWEAGAILSPVGLWFAAIFTAAGISPESLKVWYAVNYFIHTIGIIAELVAESL